MNGDDTNSLGSWQRAVSGVVGLVFLSAALLLATVATPTVSAAPSCEAPAPDGCVVRTSELVNSAIPIFLGAAAVLFALMAISGRLWTFKAAGGEYSPSPSVAPVRASEVEQSELTGAVEDVRREAPAASASGAVPTATPSQSALGLWASLDGDIASALDSQWRAWYGVTIVDKITEVKRATGKGNHAWFVRARNPEDDQVWVRVTKGGRRGGSRAGWGSP